MWCVPIPSARPVEEIARALRYGRTAQRKLREGGSEVKGGRVGGEKGGEKSREREEKRRKRWSDAADRAEGVAPTRRSAYRRCN